MRRRKFYRIGAMKEKQPNPELLLKKLNFSYPLIGFYDAPDSKSFEPIVTPGKRGCVFDSFKDWEKGKTLLITKDNYGCGGAGRSLCGIDTREREDFISFLVDGEGLKASHELMEKWIDSRRLKKSVHPYILIGPLKPDQYEYIRSVIFFVNPDQLAILAIGAQYNSSPSDPPPVIAPFGSGCSQLISFDNLNIPQAAIGTTDIAMRNFIPPDILSFAVTKPMFKQLCELDEKSFLFKPFLTNLKKARGLPDL